MEWRIIPGYEDYKVSNTGDVWHIKTGKPTKSWEHDCGYLCVDLADINGNKKHKRIHRLVMLAFVGEPPKGQNDVNHKDGNKKNNNLDNLEYCSRSYNLRHRYEVLGYKSPNGFREHALTDSDITEIRNLRGEKRKDRRYEYSINRLAEMFNVSPQTIMCIIYKCGVYKNRG